MVCFFQEHSGRDPERERIKPGERAAGNKNLRVLGACEAKQKLPRDRRGDQHGRDGVEQSLPLTGFG